MSTDHRVSGADPPGRRVLIVEDEMLIAMELQTLVEQEGYAVLGPVNSVARALALLERELPDAALLDLNLAGEQSTPIAESLAAQGVPFATVTGYGEAISKELELRGVPYLAKPINHRDLVRLLGELLPA